MINYGSSQAREGRVTLRQICTGVKRRQKRPVTSPASLTFMLSAATANEEKQSHYLLPLLL